MCGSGKNWGRICWPWSFIFHRFVVTKYTVKAIFSTRRFNFRRAIAYLSFAKIVSPALLLCQPPICFSCHQRISWVLFVLLEQTGLWYNVDWIIMLGWEVTWMLRGTLSQILGLPTAEIESFLKIQVLFLELASLDKDTYEENDYREDFADYQIQRID